MFNDNKIDSNELVQLLQKIITRVEVLEKEVTSINDKLDNTIIELKLLEKDVENSKKNNNSKIASSYPVTNLTLDKRIKVLEEQLSEIEASISSR